MTAFASPLEKSYGSLKNAVNAEMKKIASGMMGQYHDVIKHDRA
jgi:hypothetical protein